jgi:ATP-dependent Clp protease protease subunit
MEHDPKHPLPEPGPKIAGPDTNPELLAAQIRHELSAATLNEARTRAVRIEVDRYDYNQRQHAQVPRFGVIQPAVVYKTIEDIDTFCRMNPGASLTIIINTPGGSIVDGNALIDFLREKSKEGHHVTTKVVGQAASMGAIILQAGDKRVMTSRSILLLHEPSTQVMGTASNMKDEQALLDMFVCQMCRDLAKRSHLDEDALLKMFERRDRWFDATEALDVGLVDTIEGD